jgi:CheY-like chemotaxis protein
MLNDDKGSPMTDDDKRGVTRRLGPLLPQTDTLKPETPKTTPTLDFSWSVQLILKDNTKIPFRIRLSEQFLIGRSDEEEDYKPEINLAKHGAAEHGVSRRHAAITASTDYLLITDLDSTNGTRLNNHVLRPNQPYRMDHGDTIMLGNLQLRVEFNMVPIHEGLKVEHSGTGSSVKLDQDESKDVKSRAILIVEDDQGVASLLEDLLDTLKYKHHTVHRVADAMRYIAKDVPRAVLLDLKMPDYSGIEVVKMLRGDMDTRALPIFVLSGSSDTREIQAVLDAGADVFLGKPVGLNELIEALQKFVGDPE